MSTSEHGDPGTHVVIRADARTLQDLAEAPVLSEPQLRIVHWYEQLAHALAGPASGDERGPAKQPPWVKQGPRIESVALIDTPGAEFVYLLAGRGMGGTTEVWVDGRPITTWVLDGGELTVTVTEDDRPQAQVLVRTSGGDAAVVLPTPGSTGIE